MSEKKAVPPAISTPKVDTIKSGVEWYDSPSNSFQRRAKSDIPKNSDMDVDPFFEKSLNQEETSNSLDGFDTKMFQSTRRYRRRLRPSMDNSLDGKELEVKIEKKEVIEPEVNSSPASCSSSFRTRGGEDLIELGKRSVQLLQTRCSTIVGDEDCDISTPKRKRKLENEDNEDDLEEDGEDKDENGEAKNSWTLLTPSLSRGSDRKKGRIEGSEKSKASPLSVSIHSTSITPRRQSGRPARRDDLVDTPENSQEEMKTEEKEKDKKAIRREKHGNEPNFDSDDSFYDSD